MTLRRFLIAGVVLWIVLIVLRTLTAVAKDPPSLVGAILLLWAAGLIILGILNYRRSEPAKPPQKEPQGTSWTASSIVDLVFKDEATGLYNRRFFSVRFEEEVARCQLSDLPVSVVLLKLDGVGRVVDESGRKAGEEILISVATILLRHTRPVAVISRYADDLFAILMVDTPRARALVYMDQIRIVLASSEFRYRDMVTRRFGIASLPDDRVAAPEDLLRLADEALRADPGT